MVEEKEVVGSRKRVGLEEEGVENLTGGETHYDGVGVRDAREVFVANEGHDGELQTFRGEVGCNCHSPLLVIQQ